jgi:hypothetical protein
MGRGIIGLFFTKWGCEIFEKIGDQKWMSAGRFGGKSLNLYMDSLKNRGFEELSNDTAARFGCYFPRETIPGKRL